jgi:hypothetical protein
MALRFPDALYKVCREDGSTREGGSFRYPLPRGKRPGAWTPDVTPVLCSRGYHVCRIDQIQKWLSYGYAIFLVEARGAVETCDDKSAYESIRLVRRLNWCGMRARLFAADCAARCLPAFEAMVPGDERPREAVRIARLHALGKAPWSVSCAAGNEASAAWSAARSAARSAAWSAAWSAARSAELQWQAKRIETYLYHHSVPGPVPLTKRTAKKEAA